MRDIEAKAAEGHERSKLALEIFCYRAAKYIGSYAAAMGGLDAVVFTAGIGEHSPPVREMICASLGYMGVELNKEINAGCHTECDISARETGPRVLVVPTNE